MKVLRPLVSRQNGGILKEVSSISEGGLMTQKIDRGDEEVAQILFDHAALPVLYLRGAATPRGQAWLGNHSLAGSNRGGRGASRRGLRGCSLAVPETPYWSSDLSQ